MFATPEAAPNAATATIPRDDVDHYRVKIEITFDKGYPKISGSDANSKESNQNAFAIRFEVQDNRIKDNKGDFKSDEDYAEINDTHTSLKQRVEALRALEKVLTADEHQRRLQQIKREIVLWFDVVHMKTRNLSSWLTWFIMVSMATFLVHVILLYQDNGNGNNNFTRGQLKVRST